MTNKLHKPTTKSDKPVYPGQVEKCKKPLCRSGGRCRARTYDPLIKSQLTSTEIIRENFKPGHFVHKTNQWLTAVLQTNGSRA